MKNYLLLLVFLFPALLFGKPSGNPYVENMMQAKAMTDSATVEKTLITAAGFFERISGMNTGEWLPCYYAAYCYARVSHLVHNADIQDKWIDRAEVQINKAIAIDPSNAEILVMRGFVLLARMNVDPGTRGFQYSGESMSCFEKARAIDPENPRSYLWQGVNVLHTPESFGGGKDNACPLFRKSLEKFASFVQSDSLAPNWGYEYAKEMAKSCN